MFFIVPESQPSKLSESPPADIRASSPRPAKRQRLSTELDETSYYPKRTPKACDRCRLKKARCQWTRGKICDKCKRDGVICTTERESKREPKTLTAEYVQLVESQRDCLLRAVSKILECGVSDDHAAVAKILQEFGIRTDGLRKASEPEPKDGGDVKDGEGAVNYQTPEQRRPLSGNFNARNTSAESTEQASVFPPQTAPQLESYFDLPSDSFSLSDMLPEISAEALASADLSFLTSIDASDWQQLSDPMGPGWFSAGPDILVGR